MEGLDLHLAAEDLGGPEKSLVPQGIGDGEREPEVQKAEAWPPVRTQGGDPRSLEVDWTVVGNARRYPGLLKGVPQGTARRVRREQVPHNWLGVTPVQWERVLNKQAVY